MLLSKLAGAMNASLQSAVSLFAAPLSQTARVVEALRAKVEAEGPAQGPCGGGRSPAAEANSPREAEAPRQKPEAPAEPSPAAEPGNHRVRVTTTQPEIFRRHRNKERTPIMAKLSTEEMLDAFKEMTLPRASASS